MIFGCLWNCVSYFFQERAVNLANLFVDELIECFNDGGGNFVGEFVGCVSGLDSSLQFCLWDDGATAEAGGMAGTVTNSIAFTGIYCVVHFEILFL